MFILYLSLLLLKSYSASSSFRSCKYEMKVSSATMTALEKYLATCHAIILQVNNEYSLLINIFMICNSIQINRLRIYQLQIGMSSN